MKLASATPGSNRIRRELMYKAVLIVGALTVAAAAYQFVDPAKSLRALASMDSVERLEYLRHRETSDVVGYYCNSDKLRRGVDTDVAQDIEKSLRQAHGVTRIDCSD